jgi:lipid A 3-O-deacylase
MNVNGMNSFSKLRFRLAILAMLLLAAVAAVAQDGKAGQCCGTDPTSTVQSGNGNDDAAAVRREHWVFGVLASGGSGLFDRTNVQYVRGGVRVGRVMTGQIGPGILRGTFEMDAEIMPVDYVLWNGYRNVYSIGINPVVFKWNFTRGHKMIPYLLAQGGVLWSSHNVPPGDTSHYNFLSGPGIGFNYFIKPWRSINIDLRATHLSNASLGPHNPGVNSSLQLSIGYNWWKH